MTWVVLIATVTSAELQAAMLAAMSAAGLPTSSWTKDGFWQNLVQWIAGLLRLAYAILRDIALGSFLSTATGQGLTELAEGTYGTPRRTKTFATGSLILRNESGLPLDEVAESISFELKADTTVTYRNTGAVFITNNDQTEIEITCDVAGTVGNAAAGSGAGATVALVSALPGVSIVSNGAIIGQDEQEDEPLRVLASKQAAVASAGHGNKYEWLALNVNTDGTIAEANDGKTRTNINRAKIVFEDDQGRVFVTLASPSGSVDSAEYVTTVTVLEQSGLANPGILIDVNAAPVTVNVVADVVMRKGSSTDGVEDEIAAQLEAYFPDTSIGGDDGFLTLEELELEIGRANRRIVEATVTTPAGDVALADNQVAALGTLTLNITVQA